MLEFDKKYFSKYKNSVTRVGEKSNKSHQKVIDEIKKYNKENKQIMVDDKFTNINLTKLNDIIYCGEENFTDKNPVIQLMLGQFFVSDKPCTLTIIPPIFELEKNPMWSKIRLVSSRMSIHLW